MATDKVRAYSGDKPYIFISYAHRNSEAVYPIIKRMADDGFRIWYDEGIDPGTEWDENIATHVQGCGYFLAFISPQYIESENCKDELNFARDENKERVLVYLEQTKLPSGMSMRLNRLQAIHKYVYADEEEFFLKLYSSNGIETFTDKPLSSLLPNRVSGNVSGSNTTAKRTTGTQAQTTSRQTGQVKILSVNTIGTTGVNNLFPAGSYSDVISKDRFPALCFHINVANVPPTSRLHYGVTVYDSMGNAVFGDDSYIDWKPEYSRLSKTWSINTPGDPSVRPGAYRAEIWVENSAVFRYNFTITSAGNSEYRTQSNYSTYTSTTNNGYTGNIYSSGPDIQKINKLRRKLAYPKALLWSVLTNLLFVVFIGFSTSGSILMSLLALAASITMLVFHTKHTSRNIVHSGFVAFLLCSIGGFYYGIFLLIMTIITKSKEQEIKRELAAEESKR